MGDPASYISAKLASMIGGLFGGAAIMTFIRPKTIGEAFTRGGISAGSAIIFSVPLLENLGIKLNWENQLMAGFCVGFVAYSILGMVANFFIKNQNRDIVETIKTVKDDLNSKKE